MQAKLSARVSGVTAVTPAVAGGLSERKVI
jgi:hypothetical protein